MKNKILSSFICLCLVFFIGTPPALGAQTATIQDLYAQLLPADPQAQINGQLTQTAGVSAEWYVLALRQTDNYDLTSYKNALQLYLEQNQVTSATSRLKYALLLAACDAESSYIAQTLADSIGRQGLMSYVYGLHLLNNGYTTPEHTINSVIDTVLSLQLQDGGWAIIGQNSDPDATAMTIQALAPYFSTKPEVQTAVNRALTRLSALQLADGGYSSMGVQNPESAAQALIALAALGIDYTTDPRFIKNGNDLLAGILIYRLPDGDFSHTLGGGANTMSTAQVFCAAAAYSRLQNGRPGLYILDAPPANTPHIKAHWGYKEWATLALCVAAFTLCLTLYLRQKRYLKNFLAILLATALAITAVWTIQIQSVEEHAQPQSSGTPGGNVTLRISCQTVTGRAAHIPGDGMLLSHTQVPISIGDTVFDVLHSATAQQKIHLDFSGSGSSVYVKGIGNLYEFDYGDLSGWIYYVNGAEATQSCGDYPVQNGDVVEWHYTLSLGKDISAN